MGCLSSPSFERENLDWGEYVDLFSLLYLEPEPKTWASCRTVAWTLEQYSMSLVIQAQLWRALALITYQAIIHRSYDEIFRMRAAIDPTLQWDRKEMALWTELVTG